jgi:branched-chain amino acid transport system permease protein
MIFAITLLNGLAFSGLLFLLSAGLTLILGLARIVNFAHGSLFLLGGYLCITIANVTGNWWITLITSTISLAIIGGVIESSLLKRVYGKEDLLQLILTFGIVLVVEDVVKMIWGNVPYGLTFIPSLLSGSLNFMGITFPKDSIVIIGVAALVSYFLWLLFNKTRLGKQINAASSDMEMADALGINVPLLFTTVFVLGSAAAGLAGALLTLKLSLVPPLGFEYLIYAFAVVVIGGLGSYKGSICGALIVGICYSFGILLIPDLAMVFVFALLLLTLLIRPRGLFGTVEEIRAPAVAVGKKVEVEFSLFSGKLSSNTLLWAGGTVLVLFVIFLPYLASGFWVVFVTEVLILVLLATSLNMLLGAGMLSLAHAAFFGTGAYMNSLVLIHVTDSVIIALAVSVALAAALALFIGILSMRHVEIYFALLTLAFAQFVYTVVFKWRSVTGGDDGLMGIPFPSLKFLGLTGDAFTPDTADKYLYFVLVVVAGGLLVLRIILKSPFGQILQGIRENTERISFVGLNPKKYKLAAFVLAGCFAGLAGAVFAPFEMVVSPYAAHWTKSIDPIFMCIIGGVNTMVGPGLGAVIYIFFKDWLSSMMEYWRIWFGTILIVIALGFPRGIVAYLQLGLSNVRSRRRDKLVPRVV